MVDFPAPLAPIKPRRESSPTSILTPLSNGFSLVYPNDTSDNCNNGGEILSASWNLNVTTSSSSGGSSSGNFSKILIFDCACAARLALSVDRGSSRRQHHGAKQRKRQRLTSPSVDECLQMLPVLQLRFVFALLLLRALRLGGVELRKVAFVVIQPLAVLVNDVRCDSVQESSVVRDDKKCTWPSLQVVFQPVVDVIGRISFAA